MVLPVRPFGSHVSCNEERGAEMFGVDSSYDGPLVCSHERSRAQERGCYDVDAWGAETWLSAPPEAGDAPAARCRPSNSSRCAQCSRAGTRDSGWVMGPA